MISNFFIYSVSCSIDFRKSSDDITINCDLILYELKGDYIEVFTSVIFGCMDIGTAQNRNKVSELSNNISECYPEKNNSVFIPVKLTKYGVKLKAKSINLSISKCENIITLSQSLAFSLGKRNELFQFNIFNKSFDFNYHNF